MHQADSQWIPATQQQTWDALHDPEVLQRCIRGATRVTRVSANEYAVDMHVKVAAVDTAFSGVILLSDVQAPDRCAIAFEGRGSASGLAIGSATITLAPKDGGTRLSYDVSTAVGGNLAQLGEQPIDRIAERIVAHFFACFTNTMSHQPRPVEPAPAPATRAGGWTSTLVALLVLAVLGGYYMFVR
jgi:carbon monoxide dehydrogenase subunit G